MIEIGDLIDKMRFFIGIEKDNFLGNINFFGFTITIGAFASGKIFRGIVWGLEWIMFFICQNSKIDSKPLIPVFPNDKWGPWPAILLFISLIACIFFVKNALHLT